MPVGNSGDRFSIGVVGGGGAIDQGGALGVGQLGRPGLGSLGGLLRRPQEPVAVRPRAAGEEPADLRPQVLVTAARALEPGLLRGRVELACAVDELVDPARPFRCHPTPSPPERVAQPNDFTVSAAILAGILRTGNSRGRHSKRRRSTRGLRRGGEENQPRACCRGIGEFGRSPAVSGPVV